MKPRWYRARPAARPHRDAFDAACLACGVRTPVAIGTTEAEFTVLHAEGCPSCGRGVHRATG